VILVPFSCLLLPIDDSPMVGSDFTASANLQVDSNVPNQKSFQKNCNDMLTIVDTKLARRSQTN
jgi:hypothetical protein